MNYIESTLRGILKTVKDSNNRQEYLRNLIMDVDIEMSPDVWKNLPLEIRSYFNTCIAIINDSFEKGDTAVLPEPPITLYDHNSKEKTQLVSKTIPSKPTPPIVKQEPLLPKVPALLPKVPVVPVPVPSSASGKVSKKSPTNTKKKNEPLGLTKVSENKNDRLKHKDFYPFIINLYLEHPDWSLTKRIDHLMKFGKFPESYRKNLYNKVLTLCHFMDVLKEKKMLKIEG